MSSTKITIPLSTVPQSVPFTLSYQQNMKENKSPQLWLVEETIFDCKEMLNS